MNVNIYIVPGDRGPAKRNIETCTILEAEAEGGCATRTYFTEHEDVSEVGAVILGMVEAAGRIKKGHSVSIYADCKAFNAAVENGWLYKWRENGWMNSKGKPVHEADKWLKAAYLLIEYGFRLSKDDRGYKNWMREALKQRKAARLLIGRKNEQGSKKTPI